MADSRAPVPGSFPESPIPAVTASENRASEKRGGRRRLPLLAACGCGSGCSCGCQSGGSCQCGGNCS